MWKTKFNFADSKFDMSRRHPDEDVKEAVAFTNLEVGGKPLG